MKILLGSLLDLLTLVRARSSTTAYGPLLRLSGRTPLLRWKFIFVVLGSKKVAIFVEIYYIHTKVQKVAFFVEIYFIDTRV